MGMIEKLKSKVTVGAMFGGPVTEREKTTLPVVAVLLIVATILRTQPHLSNSTPFFAMSILAGFILGPKRAGAAGILAVLAMFVGDLAIGLHWTMLFVYAGVAIAALVGSLNADRITNRKTWKGRAAFAFLTSAAASTIFFIVSNLGVWLVGIDSGLALYPMTFAGLMTCFEMAVPFFTKSLTADVMYGTAFILVAMRLTVSHRESALGAVPKAFSGAKTSK